MKACNTDLDTLMSHITYIISVLSLLINCVCCQRLCSKNKDSGKAQSCVTRWWRKRHVTYLQLQQWKATKLCHVTTTFCKISVQRKVCDMSASHFKDTYATWQKLLQALSHVLDQHFILGIFIPSHTWC